MVSYSIGTIIKQHQPESLTPFFLFRYCELLSGALCVHEHPMIFAMRKGECNRINQNMGIGKERTERNLEELSLMYSRGHGLPSGHVRL